MIGGGMDAAAETARAAAVVRTFLIQRHLVALRVLEFLADCGLVVVDDQAVLDGWLARQLAPLPEAIISPVT